MGYHLDAVDSKILTLLQEDARQSATTLAARIGVSDNTIHNRIDRLETAGVITGYRPLLDADPVGFGLHVLFICSVSINERAEVAANVRSIPEVTEVTELMSGNENLLVKVIGADDSSINRTARKLDQLRLEIEDPVIISTTHNDPIDFAQLNGLGEQASAAATGDERVSEDQ